VNPLESHVEKNPAVKRRIEATAKSRLGCDGRKNRHSLEAANPKVLRSDQHCAEAAKMEDANPYFK